MAANPGNAPGQVLLRTKLYAPPPRADLVARPRLLARLDAGLRARLTLLAASAGFGKTTLLSAWRAGPVGREVPLAWVSLDSGDNDPIRFWHYLIAALDGLRPGAGGDALALLTPQTPIEQVLTALLNDLAALPEDALLVLDDYHVIETPAIGQALAFLIEHLPPRLHLVIASRADPPLPLARLRARGELVEIRAADLRFTPDEAAAFLTETRHLALDMGAVAALQDRTEGWIAGLQLAALSLAARADTAAFVAAFTGSDRYIVDYLSEEVLLRLPPTDQEFLLRTAGLDRLCAPLCATVADDIAEPTPEQIAASQATLERFESANLFLVPLDNERRWYRYHHLFADLLRGRLAAHPPDEVAAWQRRAAGWHERQGLFPHAIDHYLAARSFDQAARLVEGQLDPLLGQGELVTLRRWMDRLPGSVLLSRPRLGIYRAGLLVTQGHFAATEAQLDAVAEALAHTAPPAERAGLEGELLAVRTLLAAFRGDVAGTIALSERALAILPPDRLFMRLALPQSLALAYLESGRPLDALRLMHEIGATPAASRLPIQAIRARAMNVEIQVRLGRLRAPAADCREILAQDRERGTIPQPVVSIAALAYGEILREQNQLTEAEAHLRRGLMLGRDWGHITRPTRGRLALARLQQALGDPDSAQATLREDGLPSHATDVIAAAAAWLRVACGDVAAGAAWVQASGLRPDDPLDPARDLPYRVLARVLLAQDRPEVALPLLDRLARQAEDQGRQGDLIDIHILRALAQRSRGDLPAASVALASALTLAEPEGYIRSFLEAGPPILELLARLAATPPAALSPAVRRYSADLLAVADPVRAAEPVPQPPRAALPTQPLPEPLSGRELDVLRLMADGLTNQEIAARLFLAVSTVKWYVNAIFGKLGATSRTQAVARARAAGLVG